MLALLLTQLALAKKVEILTLSIAAVLDKKRLRQLKHEIPAQYRKQALQMDEIRSSHFLIPDPFFIRGRGWLGGTTGPCP
jgi:hypothetical protein